MTARLPDHDLEHERLIACARDLLVAADAAGEPVAVQRALCDAFTALVRSRSPAQIARMEERLERRIRASYGW